MTQSCKTEASGIVTSVVAVIVFPKAGPEEIIAVVVYGHSPVTVQQEGWKGKQVWHRCPSRAESLVVTGVGLG